MWAPASAIVGAATRPASTSAVATSASRVSALGTTTATSAPAAASTAARAAVPIEDLPEITALSMQPARPAFAAVSPTATLVTGARTAALDSTPRAAFAGSDLDLAGKSPSDLPLTMGKAGGIAGESSANAATAASCQPKTNWRRLLLFATIWALIVAIVIFGVSFLLQPLLTAQQRQTNSSIPMFSWQLPAYNAILAGVLTFALTVALGAVPKM